MIKYKKIPALLTIPVLLMVCSFVNAAESEPSASAAGAESVAEAEEDISGEGEILNILCFNEEFKTRMVDHYPTYEEVDAVTGKIGDVTVRWLMTSTDDNAYLDTLDAALAENESKELNERADIFLAEEGFLSRYIDADPEVTIPVDELGITDEDLSEQYAYTIDMASDRDGNIRGLTWQCTPGVLIYNRQAAIDTWGTDDPKKVQKHVASWDDFMEAAEDLKEKGYSITASTADTFRPYAGHMTGYWVTKRGELNLPKNIAAWMENSKKLVDGGATTTSTMWSSDWSTALMPEGNVFCTFGPDWMIRYCLSQEIPGSIANAGGWAVCQGPQSFCWRGTWICAARGTDNPTLVADIMRTLTADEYIMANIRLTDGDFVNNRKVMESDQDDERYCMEVLGGQNPVGIMIKNAETITGTRITRYDDACNSVIRSMAKRYFEGNYSYEEAEAEFRRRMQKEFPELRDPGETE